MSYKKPALREQFVEVSFDANSFDQGKIFDVIPDIRNSGYQNVEIGSIQINQINAPPIQIPRIKCWNSDKTNLIQFFSNLLVVNKVGQYFGWNDFVNLFNVALNSVAKKNSDSKISSIALTTVDEFVVSFDSYSLEKILHCGGDKIPMWYWQSKDFFDISLGKGLLNIDRFNKQIQVSGKKELDKFVITIQSIFHEYLQNRDVKSVLHSLHEESNNSFESLITDYTRNELMGGLK